MLFPHVTLMLSSSTASVPDDLERPAKRQRTDGEVELFMSTPPTRHKTPLDHLYTPFCSSSPPPLSTLAPAPIIRSPASRPSLTVVTALEEEAERYTTLYDSRKTTDEVHYSSMTLEEDARFATSTPTSAAPLLRTPDRPSEPLGGFAKPTSSLLVDAPAASLALAEIVDPALSPSLDALGADLDGWDRRAWLKKAKEAVDGLMMALDKWA